MERHWRSVTLLLVPVMTFGWLATSLCIWWMVPRLDWLDSLCCAACVTATDPVLASSVVGKGKFAKRVPKHLRDLLSAESGCNDGMAFPFVYFGIYMIRYRPDANQFSLYWFCVAILYQCVFGAIYGVIIGYIARRAIRLAHEKQLIDRESFLVFYFVLALFCAGSGSVLGLDDLLVGFACGVGFSNDGWFQEKTEESAVSNVIDLLLNLTFFVYFGTILPWEQYNSPSLGTTPWRLVVLAILVLVFRRIPIMLALKPFIPDIKSWREASFAGHFGPIGVGAIFVAILVRAEFETGTSTPLPELPPPGSPNMNIIELVWPVTTFLVLCSIVVHGSSVAVFTLGKRINTLTLTLSYTQAHDDGPSWMDRLPRIQSRSKSSMSMRRPDEFDYSKEEKGLETPTSLLSPLGGLAPHMLFRRQKDDDSLKPWSVHQRRRRNQVKSAAGPISQSAIKPASRRDTDGNEKSYQSSINELDSSAPAIVISEPAQDYTTTTLQLERNIYQEGSHTTVIEDGDGNVLDVQRDGQSITDDTSRRSSLCEKVVEKIRSRDSSRVREASHEDSQTESNGSEELEKKTENVTESQLPKQDDNNIGGNGFDGNNDNNSNTNGRWRNLKRTITEFNDTVRQARSSRERTDHDEKPRGGTARAYQFGNTIIVEDEDGEVIKKYDVPPVKRPETGRNSSGADLSRVSTRQRLQRMGTLLGIPVAEQEGRDEGGSAESRNGNGRDESAEGRAGSVAAASTNDGNDDDRLRFTMGTSGRRMSKAEFINEVMKLDSRDRSGSIDRGTSAGGGSSAGNDAGTTSAPKLTRNRPSFFWTRRNTDKSAVDSIKKDPSSSAPGDATRPGLASRGRQTSAADWLGTDLRHVPTYEEPEPETPGSEDVLRPLPSRGKENALQDDSLNDTASARTRKRGSSIGSDQETAAAERRRRLREEDPHSVARRRAGTLDSLTASASARAMSAQKRADIGAAMEPPPPTSSSSSSRKPGPAPLRRGGSDDAAGASRRANDDDDDDDEEKETAAERRRREGALGLSMEPDTDTDTESDDGGSAAAAAKKRMGVKRNVKSKDSAGSGRIPVVPESATEASNLEESARFAGDGGDGAGSGSQGKADGKGIRFAGQQQQRQQQSSSSSSPPPPPSTSTKPPPLARLRWGSDVGRRSHRH